MADILAFVELHAGNHDLAAELENEAIELAAQTGREADELTAQFRLGWIEGLRGNVEAARVACERSLRLSARTSGFTRGARLSLGYLESEHRTHHKAQARATLQRAVTAFDSAGARIWCDRARRELGRIGGRSTPAGGELSYRMLGVRSRTELARVEL